MFSRLAAVVKIRKREVAISWASIYIVITIVRANITNITNITRITQLSLASLPLNQIKWPLRGRWTLPGWLRVQTRLARCPRGQITDVNEFNVLLLSCHLIRVVPNG